MTLANVIEVRLVLLLRLVELSFQISLVDTAAVVDPVLAKMHLLVPRLDHN